MPKGTVQIETRLRRGDEAKVIRRTEAAADEYAEKVQGLVMRTARRIERAAKVNLESDPRRIDTRNLRRSIQVALLKSAGHYLQARIGSDVEYSIYAHEGTGIHARSGDGRKTPWVYFDERREQYVVTRGMKPNTFLLDAWKSEIDNFKRDLRQIKIDAPA
jgi:hypothetical protein